MGSPPVLANSVERGEIKLQKAPFTPARQSFRMNLLIHNVTCFTNCEHDAILTGSAVAIKGCRICEVGPEIALKEKYREFTQLDGHGRLLMPGMVNVHTHFYSTFARGLALPVPPKNFAEILSQLWWKLDAALDLEAVYYSALIAAITMVKHGVTAVIDHHASSTAVDGSLDRIQAALSSIGARGVLCYETSDRDGKPIAQQGLRENERYVNLCQAASRENPDHPFGALVGLHASFTLDDDTLERAAALCQSHGTGCHIHVLEDEVDRDVTRRKYQSGVVDRLERFGILGERTIAAHCIHVSESEKDALAQTNTIVAHNPQSNMNNAVGRTDAFGLMQRGILLGLGTDGMSPSLFPDARTAHLLHKHDLGDCNAGWNEMQRVVLQNNPEIYRKVSGRQVGQIKPGYLADLILVDYYPPTSMTSDNLWGHFLYGIADARVDTTIINGEIVMQNGVIPNLDEREVAHNARLAARRVWERFYST